MKRALKVLILLIVLLLTIFSFNFTIVMAAETDNIALAEQIINIIPDTLNININQIEYEKAEEEIKNIIIDMCKENGINTDSLEEQGININVSTSLLYSIESFHSAIIEIDNNGTSLAGKEIKLSYKNESDHNTDDEEFVKNIKLSSPNYFEISLDDSRIK